MSTKHNTVHQSRGKSGYGQKLVRDGRGSPTMSNPVLSDGKRASGDNIKR